MNVSVGGLILGQRETFKEQLDCIAETEFLITGGTRAKEKEFPHMVTFIFLLYYKSPLNAI